MLNLDKSQIQDNIDDIDSEDEFDKYRYNNDERYRKYWDDKVIIDSSIHYNFSTPKYYLACYDILTDEIYFHEYFSDEIIKKNNIIITRQAEKYEKRINILHKYWKKIENLSGFNKTSYISDKAKNYFKRTINSHFIHPETKGLFNNHNCQPLPCIFQNYGEIDINVKVHLNCFNIEEDKEDKKNEEEKKDQEENKEQTKKKDKVPSPFLLNDFEFNCKIPFLYVVDTIIQDTINHLKIFLINKIKEKLDNNEDNREDKIFEEKKGKSFQMLRRRPTLMVKKLNRNFNDSDDVYGFKAKLEHLENGLRKDDNEYQFVLKLAKFDEYLFGDYSINSYEFIRGFIRQFMTIPLILIKVPKYLCNPRISTFPPIICMKEKEFTYYDLLEKYLTNYDHRSVIFRFGECEEKEKKLFLKTSEEREEKLTRNCESGDCDFPFEVTVVGLYNFKLIFKWLNDDSEECKYNKNEMILNYFNEFQTNEEYENGLLKNRLLKIFGCKSKKKNLDSIKTMINNEDAKSQLNGEEKKQQEEKDKQQEKDELKEKTKALKVIHKSNKNDAVLQKNLNFLCVSKSEVDEQNSNSLLKNKFNSPTFTEETERKKEKLQEDPFYPAKNQAKPKNKHLKFPPTFVRIKLEMLYGCYEIESYQTRYYVINNNIDMMEKIIFNTDKLIISHLPRETRLGISVCLLNKDVSSKIEIGSAQIPLYNEQGELFSGDIKINIWPMFKINPRINCCDQFLMKNSRIIKHPLTKIKKDSYMPKNNNMERSNFPSEDKSSIKKSRFRDRQSDKFYMKDIMDDSSDKTRSDLRDSLSGFEKKSNFDYEKNSDKTDKKKVGFKGEGNNNINNINNNEEDLKLKKDADYDLSEDETYSPFSTESYNSNDYCYIILKFPKFVKPLMHTQKTPISYYYFLQQKELGPDKGHKNPFNELYMTSQLSIIMEEFKESAPFIGTEKQKQKNYKKKKSSKDDNTDNYENSYENLESFEVTIDQVEEKLKNINSLFKNDPFSPISPEDKKKVLLCRDYLSTLPKGIDIFLRSINWFNPLEAYLGHLYLKRWVKLEPEDAIGLLDARFPDTQVRELAIKTLSNVTDDIIELYMLQLCQCLFYESNYLSPLADFIIEKSLKNKKLIGNKFYWSANVASENFLFRDRLYTLLAQLFMMSGPSFIDNIEKKKIVNEKFLEVGYHAKRIYSQDKKEESIRSVAKEIERLFDGGKMKFEIPVHPSYFANGFCLSKLKLFSSKMVPMALCLFSYEGYTFNALFKIGDDLRQDAMVLQIFKIMDKIWLENDLDLKLSIYNICPIGLKYGFMEFVDGTTIEEVQNTESTIGGALDRELLYNYLKKKSKKVNKSKDALSLENELDNFIRSLAGYCVATCCMGIADRHPANVMVKDNGIFFHIDFGHIFGNFKVKFGFKRERSLFLLTPNMAYIYTKSNSEEKFKNYCVDAFNILRRNATKLINLIITVSSCNMPEFSTMYDVIYLKNMLQLDKNNDEEAATYFIGLIKSTVNEKFRIFDNLIHNCVHK